MRSKLPYISLAVVALPFVVAFLTPPTADDLPSSDAHTSSSRRAGAPLNIPAPNGYVELTPEMDILYRSMQSANSSVFENGLLASYIPRTDANAALQKKKTSGGLALVILADPGPIAADEWPQERIVYASSMVPSGAIYEQTQSKIELALEDGFNRSVELEVTTAGKPILVVDAPNHLISIQRVLSNAAVGETWTSGASSQLVDVYVVTVVLYDGERILMLTLQDASQTIAVEACDAWLKQIAGESELVKTDAASEQGSTSLMEYVDSALRKPRYRPDSTE